MAGQTLGCGAQGPVRAKAVHSAYADVQDALSSLASEVATLTEALAPVLSFPRPAGEDTEKAPAYASSLACDIQQTGIGLRKLVEHVRDLLSRLEV